MTAPETLAPAIPAPAASLSPDRADLAIETARQPGGALDPDSWIAPTPERLAPFLAQEPDQARIDRFAYDWLQTGSGAKAKGHGGGIDAVYKAGLQTYVDFRKGRGEEPFQFLPAARSRADDRAAREQVPFFQKLFTAPERMAEALPEDQRQAFEDRFSSSLDPVAEKQRTAGVMLVSSMTGKPADQVADLWPAYRDRYASEHLGLTGEVDDAAFYQAAGKAFEKEAKDDTTARDIARQAQQAAIQGKPLAAVVAAGKALTGEEWKRFQPAARSAYAGILAEFSDREIKAGRALFEAVADIEGRKVEDLAKGDGTKAAWVIALESYGSADQATRDRMMALIGMQADAEGEEIGNYFERLGAATQSGSDMISTGIGALSARSDLKLFEDIAAKEQDPAKRQLADAQVSYMKGKAAFAQDLQTAGVRVRRHLDREREGFWDTAGDWTVMAAESLPIMAAAAIPYGAGLPAIMAAYGEKNLSTLRRAAPNVDEASLTAAAYTSGVMEAGIDRLQFLTLGARLPKLNSKLLQYGKPGAVAVGVSRAGVVTVAESGQEILQDLTLPMVQEVADALGTDIPGPNWSKVLAQEADALGDIVGVSLIFGIIGGAGSTITDYMQAPRVAQTLQDREGLALAGYSAETIEEVATLAAENPAAAAETLKAAMIETSKEERQANAQAARERLDSGNAERRASRATAGRVTSYGYANDSTPDANSSAGIVAWVSDEEAARIRAGEDTPNKLRPGDLAVSRDIEAQFRDVGISPGEPVSLRLDDGTEISGRWMDRTAEEYDGRALTGRFDIYSPAGANLLNDRQVVGFSHTVRDGASFPTAEDAGLPTMEKLPDGRVQVTFPDVPAVLVDSNEDALEAVRNWDEQAAVDTTRAVREHLDFLTDYHAGNPEAVFVGKQTGQDPTLETWAGNSKERIATANARIDIMMRQAGTDMGIERPLLSDVPILGTSRNIRAGAVTRMVSEINRTGTPLTVIEEAAEGVAKWLLADSKISESKMIGWIRQTEQGTRTKILADDIATMDGAGRAQEIAEGFSFIAKNNAVGKIQDSALPTQVKAFFRAFKEQIAAVLRLAADFARLRTEGKVDPEFGYWLDVAAGLEPEFQMENLTRQMEAELIAESMEGFTEIQAALKGELPHPDTLNAAGDPLTGEVRGLWEGMMENPENGASKAARTRKVNEFFLQKGQTANLDEIRRSINEQGFDFATPAEMLEAADLSINYGKKQYGTRDSDSQTEEDDDWNPTFSIAFRTDPLLAAIEARVNSPEKKAETYKKMKARVADVKRRFEDRRLRGDFDNKAGDIDQKRFEQIRDLATLEAIGKAMPPEIRGKIVGSFRKVADLKTTKGRQKYMLELLPKIENALESMLQRNFRAAIRRQMKQAAFKVGDSRTRGGKIGALGHAVFEEAKAAMKLTDDSAAQIGGKSAAEKADAKADELRTMLEGAPDLTDEQIAELDGRISAVELFGDYSNANSARLEEALGFLAGTYTEGRREWLDVLTARRDMRTARVSIVEAAMGRAGPITDAERNAMKRRFEGTLTRLDEGIMQAGLSGSQKLRRLAELSQDPEIAALTEDMELAFLEAENVESDTNDADSKALAQAMRRIFDTSTEYGTAKKLRELTTATGPAPVEKIEGRKVEKVKVPVKFAEAILAGDLSGLEAGGEKFAEEVKTFDDHDLAQLELEFEHFSDLPETEQARKRNLTFERIVADGTRMTIGQVNQLEGLQLYLSMRQPDQAAKLARLGYDEETLAQLEIWLKPETLALGAWMVDHIGAEAFTLDSIHRAEKGVGLKLVENYFPVRNDVAGADNTGLSINGGAAQHTGKSIGAIKERISNNAAPAYVNAVAVFLANRAQTNFWKAHVASLRDWGGVIRDERFAAAVKVRMGETFYQSLDTLLKRIESGGALNAAKLLDWEKLVKSLTSSFAIGTLGGRVSTLAVNLAAGLNVGLEIPANELAAGIAEVFKRPEAFKDAFNSPAIQRRLTQGATYEAQLAKSAGPSRNPTLATLNAWAQRGVMPINWVDTGANVIGAAVVWEHTRKNSLRAGMTADEAHAAADRKVTRLLLRSAQPTTRLAKSEIELKAAENPLAALFTLFTSEPRKTLAILYMAGRELSTGKGTYGKPMAAQQLFVAFVIFQTADFVIRQAYAAVAKADDDEPEDILARLRKRIFDPKAWGYALTTSHLRAVPIGGEVWSQAWAKVYGQKAFTGSQNPLNRATREVLTFEKPETTEEAIDGAIDILQGVGPTIPGGALFAQGGNLAEFVAGVATSSGVSFSDEDRLKRLKTRFSKFTATLDDIHGKTQQPTGKAGPDGKPATKTDKAIQSAKHAAMIDRLRADLAPLSPELRQQTLDAVTAPQEVKDMARKLLTAPTP